jgi:tRNA-specific 2-thiouridylase
MLEFSSDSKKVKEKVIVGISGGVDSAVAALILKESGYLVKGLHISNTQINCTTRQTLKQISESIDIPVEIIQADKKFNEVVIYHFRTQLLAGLSPSLCTYCNPNFKWRILADYATKKNSEFISTGHYIQLARYKGSFFIKKGIDDRKDQSYYLWNLPNEIINRMITPLGVKTKKEVKKTAEENNLEFLLNKNESTGLCFSNKLTYPDLIKKYIPEVKNIKKGIITDKLGRVIGTHNGYIFYTIGQKKDLMLDTDLNYCVTKIDPHNNILIAGDPNELWTKQLYITDFNFKNEKLIIDNSDLEVKIRGFGWNPKGKAGIRIIDNKTAEINLENPSWAPAAGQSAVIFHNNILVGGGVII